VDISFHPWQISQRINGAHGCGATLIANTKGVTGGHCVGGFIGIYTVVAGTTDQSVSVCTTCNVRPLTNVVRHPDFSNNGAIGYPNDIATLYFASIPNNININPIAMAATGGDYAGQNCIVTGWGQMCSSGCGLTNVLQQGTMAVLTNAQCATIWSANQINNGHVCVQSPSVAPCNGDSGGPLVCGGNTLIGLHSWGASGCNPAYPSVFTRISWFRTWIDSN